MTYEAFVELLERRRSIRYFEKKPIEKQILDKILATGVMAPSVSNTQPWHFHVLENTDLKEKIMEHSCYGNFVVGAATLIVVTCNKAAKAAHESTIWNPREMEYSCAIAMQNIMLAATTLEIGSCWVSLHHGPTHNFLKLPDHNVVIGGIMLGYLKEGEKEPSGEHERRPLENVVTYLK